MKSNPQHKAVGGVYAGCSGWAYASWKPEFYPAKTSPKRMLEFYASRLNSVEVNYTFRSLPSAAMVENWLAQTGEAFRFSFKAPQRITHFQRLRECGASLEALAAAVEPVRGAGRMGLALFQLPPNFRADVERLKAFLRDAKPLRMRIAFEFRHESWLESATYQILEKFGAALCMAESDELSTPDVATAAFGCYRLRKSRYSARELSAVADRLLERSRQGEVFAYFRHEEEPTGALRAMKVLNLVRKRGAR